MEPLLPSSKRSQCNELTASILKKSGELTGLIHSPIVQTKVAHLVRQMNCYYSNLIEGHRTTPRDIELAMQEEYSENAKERDNQMLGRAHVFTEKNMEELLRNNPETDVYSDAFIRWIHKEFYSNLPDAFRRIKADNGETYSIAPGEYREYPVHVGRHFPPLPSDIEKFMLRFSSFYRKNSIQATSRLLVTAAAHQRLGWIHPFGDGNGRVMRLHSHAILIKHDMDGKGLWTLSRGLARQKDTYYSKLEFADQPRYNDYDGRGNLTDKGLADFCIFFLETILDQVEFMSGLLNLSTLRERVQKSFQLNVFHLKTHNENVMKVVRVLIDEGEIPRGKVKEIAGCKGTVAAEIIRTGLDSELFESRGPRSPLQISFPEKVLDYYFPSLYLA